MKTLLVIFILNSFIFDKKFEIEGKIGLSSPWVPYEFYSYYPPGNTFGTGFSFLLPLNIGIGVELLYSNFVLSEEKFKRNSGYGDNLVSVRGGRNYLWIFSGNLKFFCSLHENFIKFYLGTGIGYLKMYREFLMITLKVPVGDTVGVLSGNRGLPFIKEESFTFMVKGGTEINVWKNFYLFFEPQLVIGNVHMWNKKEIRFTSFCSGIRLIL